MSSFLVLEGLAKSFAGAPSATRDSPGAPNPLAVPVDLAGSMTAVLRGVSLAVEAGEILALLGPSGSGKTTLLRLLAGFEVPDAGRILLAGEEITHLPPARRGIGMVFQHYALFPHLSVGGNVAFGLESRGLGRDEVEQRVAEALATVDLPGMERRRIAELSGGQQQRVALARALAPRPRVLLLDEPLSNLDPVLREWTRRQLAAIIRRIGITTVFVTHEQEEAFDLGDRVALLFGGRLEQVGRPEELYRAPASYVVASFVGRSSRLLGTVVERQGEKVRVALAPAGAPVWEAEAGEPELATGQRVELLVRPESLTVAAVGAPAALAGTLVSRRFAGAFSLARIELAGAPGEVEALASTGGAGAQMQEPVGVLLRPEGPPPRAFAYDPMRDAG